MKAEDLKKVLKEFRERQEKDYREARDLEDRAGHLRRCYACSVRIAEGLNEAIAGLEELEELDNGRD